MQLFEVFRSEEAMRYWSSLPHQQVSETEQFIEDTLSHQSDVTTDFVIEKDGLVIGKAGFWQGPEVGFILHPMTWGQGLATEVLQALLDYGFQTLGYEEITADVDPRNSASLGLLKKFHFEETGRAERTFLLGEEWVDSIYLSLKRPH